MARACPQCGGASTDPEFCSDCGASLAPPPAMLLTPAASVAPPEPAPGGVEACPVCGEPRPGPFARYCDNCRYDFQAKLPFSADPPPGPPAPPPLPPAPAPSVAIAGQWDCHAAVDLSLRRPEDPMPTDTRSRIFPLDHADHLIGRRSDKEDIHPEITIDDPGISRRHARILRAADGALSLLDLGSMNGTKLDGSMVEPNVPMPLAEGSQVTLGCWTRLVLRAR